MNEKDIFLKKIYRNSYIRKIIFRHIKQINKSLKYIRYNFYDAPLGLIINNKNEEMLIEKLKLHQIQRDNQFDNNIVNYENHYKYYLDFNPQDYKKLLLWKNLNLETFKIYFNHFKSEILKQKEWFETLVLGNGVNVDILKFIINSCNYKSPNQLSHELENFFLYYIKRLNIVNMSLEMFNYIFKSSSETSHYFSVNLTNPNSIFKILSTLLDNKKSNQDTIIGFFNLLPDGFIHFGNINSELELFTNKIIESNNLQLFKLLLEKIQISNGQLLKENQVIQLYDYKIQKTIFNLLKIKLNSFNSNNIMFPLFKELVEKVYKNDQLFTKRQSKIIEINGPDYSDYVIEKLKLNGIPLVNKFVKFTYKCQRDLNECTKEQLANNYNLLNKDLMTVDHFKCQLLNNDNGLFDIYLSKFGFQKKFFFDALGLGYQDMCIHIFKKNIHLEYVGVDYHFYYYALLDSLPSHVSDGYPRVVEMLKPLINNVLPRSIKHQDRGEINIFEIIKNKSLPLNPNKRRLFISKLKETFETMESFKIEYTLTRLKNQTTRSDTDGTGKFIYDYLDFDKSILNNLTYSQRPKDDIFTKLFMDSISTGSFKLMKKISKFKPKIQRMYVLFYNCSNHCNFKSLFYLISKLNYVKLYPINSLSYSLNYNIPKSTQQHISLIKSFCELSREDEEPILNLLLGINQFKNFNFFYSLTKGTTINQDLDLQSASEYLIISQMIVTLKYGKNSVEQLISTCTQSNYKSSHSPSNFKFVNNLFDKNNSTFSQTIKYFSIPTLFFQSQIPILKLFGIYSFTKEMIKPNSNHLLINDKDDDNDNDLIDSINKTLYF